MTNHFHPKHIRDRFTAAMRELSELMPLMRAHNAARMVDAVHALERDRDRVVDPRDAEIARLREALSVVQFIAQDSSTLSYERLVKVGNIALDALKGADNV